MAIAILRRHINLALTFEGEAIALRDDFRRALAAEKAQEFPTGFFMSRGGWNCVTPAAHPTESGPPFGQLRRGQRRNRKRVIQIAAELREVLGKIPVAVDLHRYAAHRERIELADLRAALKRIDRRRAADRVVHFHHPIERLHDGRRICDARSRVR